MFNPLRPIVNFIKREFFVSEKKRDKHIKNLGSIIGFAYVVYLINSAAEPVDERQINFKRKIASIVPKMHLALMQDVSEMLEQAITKGVLKPGSTFNDPMPSMQPLPRVL
jgi:hypothetical protein